jgi:hypothetical protein
MPVLYIDAFIQHHFNIHRYTGNGRKVVDGICIQDCMRRSLYMGFEGWIRPLFSYDRPILDQ